MGTSRFPVKGLESGGGRVTEKQLLSLECSTGGKGSQPRLWNIHNLDLVQVLGQRFSNSSFRLTHKIIPPLSGCILFFYRFFSFFVKLF